MLHVDGKIFRSLRALFVEPGQLTVEYWKGHVVSWIRPLRLFLIAAAVHLLIAHSTVGPMNFRVMLSANATSQRKIIYGTLANPAALLKPGETLVTGAELDRFTQDFRRAYSPIRYSSVLLFALLSWLVYRRRQAYLVNHLILSLHYYAFWYLAATAFSFDSRLGNFGAALATIYLPIALRRIYGDSWPVTVAKSLVLLAGLIAIEAGLAGVALKMIKAF